MTAKTIIRVVLEAVNKDKSQRLLSKKLEDKKVRRSNPQNNEAVEFVKMIDEKIH